MPLKEVCIKHVINQQSSCKIAHLDASSGLIPICNPFLRVSTPDDVDPGGGGVAHTGLTGVKAGVPQAGLLDQQEGGGRRAFLGDLTDSPPGRVVGYFLLIVEPEYELWWLRAVLGIQTLSYLPASFYKVYQTTDWST